MSAVVILLALSALIGFALGTSLPWLAIAASSFGLAVLSSAVLQIQGFAALPGIAIVAACLTVNQMAYLAGALRRSNGLIQKQTDNEPSQRRHNDFAGEPRLREESAKRLSENRFSGRSSF